MHSMPFVLQSLAHLSRRYRAHLHIPCDLLEGFRNNDKAPNWFSYRRPFLMSASSVVLEPCHRSQRLLLAPSMRTRPVVSPIVQPQLPMDMTEGE